MNLKDTFLRLEKYFSLKIIGEVNDQYIKVAKYPSTPHVLTKHNY